MAPPADDPRGPRPDGGHLGSPYALHWSPSEKKVARRAFEAALEAELAELLARFKARAAAAAEPDDMWSIADDLQRERRAIQEKYDYRYSQLPVVFGVLLREGRIREAQLDGLAEEKLAWIRRVATR